LLSAALCELQSSRQRGEPPTDEEEEEEDEEEEEPPSSPPEPELELPLLWKEVEEAKAKQGWVLSLSMDTGLFCAGKPPQEPT